MLEDFTEIKRKITMPTYSYRCVKCGKVFEVFHGINETEKPKCPDCQGNSERAWGVGTFMIKGCPCTKR